MQSFKVLLNATSATTAVTQTSIDFSNKYYAYGQGGLNNGIVTEFTVNQFLENEENIDISSDFFNYLTGNTTNSELKEIVDSNKKLADTFTNYYNTSITSGLTTPVAYIDQSLTGTSAVTVTNYNYDLIETSSEDRMLGSPSMIIPNEGRIGNQREELTTFTSEESYYLPICISRNAIEIARIDFTEFSGDCFREVEGQDKFLTQCFVDLNKNKDPNSFWSDV